MNGPLVRPSADPIDTPVTNYRVYVPDIVDEFAPGDWIQSVAGALTSSRLQPLFTLGESVAELHLWASSSRDESWMNAGNRKALYRDIDATKEALGPRLCAHLDDLLPVFHSETDRRVIGVATAEFGSRWHQPASVRAAFRDLCEAASALTSSAEELKPKADVLASQLGGTVGSAVLGTVSRILSEQPFRNELDYWLGSEERERDLSLASRLRAAEKLITAIEAEAPITAWLLYRHAQIEKRVVAGPIMLCDAAWAIDQAAQATDKTFEEHAELAKIQESQPWFRADKLFGDEHANESYVLARIDLGQRVLDGAEIEAVRRVDAFLSIVIGAGGVDWTYTGVCAIQVGERLQATSINANPRRTASLSDANDMRRTLNLIEHWSDRIGDALSTSVLPDFLAEALQAFREASSMIRRDREIPGRRIVTSRIATALEDHTVELIASLAGLTPDRLISALEATEVDHEWRRLIIGPLLRPLLRTKDSPPLAHDLEDIWADVSAVNQGGSRVLVPKSLWRERDRVRALPLTSAIRIAFEQSLEVISSADCEARSRRRVHEAVALTRLRHRRVRNAITHGNPVTPAAIDSIRGFSERMARTAIGLALDAFAKQVPPSELLSTWEDQRTATDEAMADGKSLIDRS